MLKNVKKNDEKIVSIPLDTVKLEGHLALPERCKTLVVFAHGSGSSRFSPRNNFVAKILQQRGIGTLLFDLLTIQEDEIYKSRFNIHLLKERLIIVTQWVLKNPQFDQWKIGYFGASTGAAAAIMAAAELKNTIAALVSRGGRPDLAADVLEKIITPILLIVGEKDSQVLALNRYAYDHIKAEKQLSIIPQATHLFEEPGTLEKAAFLAADWFEKYFL